MHKSMFFLLDQIRIATLAHIPVSSHICRYLNMIIYKSFSCEKKMQESFVLLINNEYSFLIGITNVLFGLISKIRQQLDSKKGYIVVFKHFLFSIKEDSTENSKTCFYFPKETTRYQQ